MPYRRLSSLIAAATLSALSTSAPAEGIYGQVSGGFNNARDQDFGAGEESFDEGGMGALSMGFSWPSGLRAEGEYAHRSNEVATNGSDTRQRFDTVMGNTYYDFGGARLQSRLHPYIGLGAGFGKLDLDGTNVAIPGGSDHLFAYQGLAGIGYDLSRKLMLSAGYRYLQTERFNNGSGQQERYRSDGVLASLRYTFGPAPVRVAETPQPAVAVVQAPAPAPLPAPIEQPEVASFETVVLRPVNFQFDRAELTDPSQTTLEELATRLATHDDIRVLISGHTDAIGSEEYNRELGLRRAESVRDYLVSKGVKPANIELATAGKDRPVADNSTPEGRALNRRAEVSDRGKPANVKIQIEGPTAESVEAAKPGDPGAK